MNVLSISHLFPNKVKPNFGIFVKERVLNVSKIIDNIVIAPKPYFPFLYLTNQYRRYDQIGFKEKIDNMTIYHPKFFYLPKILKFIDFYLYYLSLNSIVSRIIKEKDIEMIDCHWGYPDGIASLFWAKKFNLKIILTVRGNESLCFFERSIRKKICEKKLSQFDHIISVSNELKMKMINHYGIPEHKITVISNGININNFYRIEKKQAQQYCKLDSNKKYILCLSRLSHEKGIDSLLLAFSKMKSTDVVLLIVGDGPMKLKLKNLSNSLGINDRVRFVGTILNTEVYKWYNASDVYCLPSLWEGCPNTIIESLACGIPVVASNVGGIPDLIPSSDYGFLVEPKDTIALSYYLDKALEVKWDHEKIVKFGTRSTWDNVSEKVISVYEKVMEGM